MAETGITRQQAYALVLEKIGRNNLLKHILSVEVGMRRLAEHLGEDVEFWGLTGLLHDLDYNETKDDEPAHTYITEQWLESYRLPDEMIYAIRAHPGHVPCRSRLDWALFATDPATGFIVACALMHPLKKLAVIEPVLRVKIWPPAKTSASIWKSSCCWCTAV